MDFNYFRNEINSKNASVKELINDIFKKIDFKDSDINSYMPTRDNAIVSSRKYRQINKNKEHFLL